jgi:hypothetical protein
LERDPFSGWDFCPSCPSLLPNRGRDWEALVTSGLLEIDRLPSSYFKKQWAGGDYGSPVPPSGLQSYWKRTDEAISNAELSGFAKVLAPKGQRLPKRASNEDHSYTMDKTFFVGGPDAIWTDYLDSTHTIPAGSFTKSFWELYSFGYSSNFGSVWNSNDDTALTGKIRERIIGSDFDMGVFLGEGKEALALIANTAVRTREYLSALRRADIPKIAKALGLKVSNVRGNISPLKGKNSSAQALSEANLSIQYGWLPLLKDAEGAAQALAQQLNHPAVQTYRVRIRRPLTGVPVTTFLGGVAYRGEVLGQMIARLREVNVPGLNGLVDPSSVAWELTPWSFVADWFIPIGSYLHARALSSFTTGTYVKTIFHRESFWGNNANIRNIFRVVTQSASGGAVRVKVQRTVMSSLEVPLPSFKSLSDVPSWKRAANAVSLLVTSVNRWR